MMSQVLVSGVQATADLQGAASLFRALQEASGISAGVFFIVIMTLLLAFLAIIWFLQGRSEKGNGDSGDTLGGEYSGTAGVTDDSETGAQAQVVNGTKGTI